MKVLIIKSNGETSHVKGQYVNEAGNYTHNIDEAKIYPTERAAQQELNAAYGDILVPAKMTLVEDYEKN
jgi:hypothetical protein